MAEDNDAVNQAFNARQAFWSKWGAVHPDVIAPIINPTFSGGPRWPSFRQSWRVVRRGPLTLVASDGLSDHFEDEKPPSSTGFGLEFFALTADRLDAQIQRTWLFELVFQCSQLAASNRRIRPMLEQLGTISTQVYGVDAPDEWKTDDGSVGLLLNLHDTRPDAIGSTMSLPLGKALAVNVKMLTRLELQFIAANGERGRADVAQKLVSLGDIHGSSVSRRSVVSPPQ